MLLSTTLNLSLKSVISRKSFYIAKGYNLAELINNKTKNEYKDAILEVNIEDIPKSSRAIIQFLCDYCLQENKKTICEAKYCDYNKNKSINSKDACKEHIKDKIKEANLLKYGTENQTQNNEVKNKREQTNIKRYGVKNPQQNKEVQEKTNKTNLIKYGSIYTFENEQVQEKIKATLLKNYGVDNPLKNKEIQEKQKETCLHLYGAKSYVESKEWKEIKYLSFIKYLENYDYELLMSLDEFILNNSQKGFSISIKCNKCQTKFNQYCSITFVHDKSSPHCPNCKSEYVGRSKEEDTLYDFIKSIYSKEIIRNSRTLLPSKKEIDIYLPELKIGFEYDSLIWHSEIFGRRNYTYHIKKQQEARDEGIQIYSIYDYEWKEKRLIVESIISQKLGINQTKIFARKCEIKEVSTKEALEFYNFNHIQTGKSITRFMINIGLYYNDKLFSVGTFGEPRFSKYEYELIRFSTKLNHQILGGFSKILKYFEKTYKPKTIITYADSRLFSGEVYSIAGFKYQYTTNPNYIYIKHGVYVGNRYKFQKHKLNNILEKFNSELSEFENMVNNKYDRVWDCGNKVFVKTLS